MKCQCPEPGKCPAHGGRVMSERQWGQCRSSDEFYDAFHALGPGPSLTRRAANATAAAGRAVMAKACGQKVQAPPEVIAARREVCDACPSRDGQWCRERRCGCFLPLKSVLLTETCPLGKWPSPAIDGGDAVRFGDHGPAGAGEPEPPVR